MAPQANFTLPASQDGLVQISLAPPTSISGWTIQWDLMYQMGSLSPIVSKFMSSGFTSGQSGITLVHGDKGVFNVQLFASEISGVSLGTGVLAHNSHRIDSGFATPINAGFRLLAPF